MPFNVMLWFLGPLLCQLMEGEQQDISGAGSHLGLVCTFPLLGMVSEPKSKVPQEWESHAGQQECFPSQNLLGGLDCCGAAHRTASISKTHRLSLLGDSLTLQVNEKPFSRWSVSFDLVQSLFLSYLLICQSCSLWKPCEIHVSGQVSHCSFLWLGCKPPWCLPAAVVESGFPGSRVFAMLIFGCSQNFMLHSCSA